MSFIITSGSTCTCTCCDFILFSFVYEYKRKENNYTREQDLKDLVRFLRSTISLKTVNIRSLNGELV